MSNKIVPTVYRSIVDDVISNMKSEFEEFGISEHVLQELQSKWESKILRSNVAEFEKPGASSSSQSTPQPPPPQPTSATYAGMPPLPPPPQPRYAEHPPPPQPRYQDQLPSLPQAPPLPGPPPGPGMYTRPGGSYPLHPNQNDLSLPRIPQLDGPSVASSQEDDSESDGSPSPPQKSVPLPSVKRTPAVREDGSGGEDDDDARIGSDLDDESDDNDDHDDDDIPGGAKVLCTYDRVQRVKNKWKCVLKDGMVHINGKDYLFSKCTGEFEW
ncbi:transcription factor IIA, alpha/beta subunit [Clavulina sp. PMI_390]|nr:transcription factor IIA, alpha/beta subunit [Clavulina sp. PMI_390]